MSLDATGAAAPLSSWFFPLVRKKRYVVLPAVRGIPPGLCPRFRVAQAAWEDHRPALHLQADFPERHDLHGRVL
jgi:hypothetical protein